MQHIDIERHSADQFRGASWAAVLLFACLLVSAPGLWAAPALELPAPEAYARAADGELVIIDIRRSEEWRQTGVGAGVLRIPMIHPRGEAGFLEEVLAAAGGHKDAPIALICRTGNRTTHLQRYLQAQGFTNVINIKEGMIGSAAGPGWIRRGLPVEPCPRC
jgi:rhodanese-related sulfurtransferase